MRIRGAPVCQKVPKSYFQSQFSMSKIDGIFTKKNSFKNMNLGDHFLEKLFFLTPIFELLYFVKMGSSFVTFTLGWFSLTYNHLIFRHCYVNMTTILEPRNICQIARRKYRVMKKFLQIWSKSLPCSRKSMKKWNRFVRFIIFNHGDCFWQHVIKITDTFLERPIFEDWTFWGQMRLRSQLLIFWLWKNIFDSEQN